MAGRKERNAGGKGDGILLISQTTEGADKAVWACRKGASTHKLRGASVELGGAVGESCGPMWLCSMSGAGRSGEVGLATTKSISVCNGYLEHGN